MAGYREFLTGEVLTAANVNDFLMEQSVMTFADATARASALSGVLREGILTYNEDTAQLEVYDGSAFVVAAPAPPAGIGSNVVQTVKTDTFTTTASTYTTITGLSLTITPTSANSKVLVSANVTFATNSTGRSALSLFENGTNLAVPTSPGSRIVAMMFAKFQGFTNGDAQMWLAHLEFLASPGTISPVTYDVRTLNDNGDFFALNRTVSDANTTGNARGVSSITAIEVAA